MTTVPTTEPRIKRWTRDEYYRLADSGVFQDQRVELIDGIIVEMTPQKHQHALSIGLVERSLRRAFGPDRWIRIQLPLRLIDDSEPEPDIAVVAGDLRDYTDHPTTALLVVEIAEFTLAYDRARKANLYASAGIADYWIVNLVDRRLEVHRRPVTDASAEFAHRYEEQRILGPSDRIAPVAMPQASIAVADLLP